jgi:hypothetical protein
MNFLSHLSSSVLLFFIVLFVGLDAHAMNRNNKTLIVSHCSTLVGHDYFCAPDTTIPRVFIKGQNEKLEEILNQHFPKQLLYAYKDDSQNAFAAWARMVWEMQKFGEDKGFDVKGLKAFATFYYDRKGNIRHIAYSLKGNSRYFKSEDLDRFFKLFMNYYKLPDIKSKYNFQHEFTLSLPYPRIIERQ